MYWPINEPPFYSAKVAKANQWTMVSAVNTRSTFTSGNYNFRIDFDNGKKAGNMWFDGLMLIDLTACFGAGNEPDVTWCDANIPYFTDRVEIKVEYPVSSGVARKVKNIYIGVDGVARRVKKAYIGVEGVARCFWSGNSIEIKKIGSGAMSSGYTGYGLINPKVFAVGNSYFAVGGGTIGENGGSATTLQIFNDEGTKQSTTLSINSTVATHKGACESVGNYGVYSSATSSSTTIKAVDTSLTSSTVYMPSSGSPRVWARLPNYALCVYSIGMAVDSSLTTKAITSNKV